MPTGGGKTFRVVAALSKIFWRFLGHNKGFVLWIVPNEAIYTQTKCQLTDHQMLDVLSGNAVRILDTRSGSDWHTTLSAAVGRLRKFDAAGARTLQAETGRYIRPIDVKEWLTNTAGLDEAEIAIKTADTNDRGAPENQDLLSPLNRIRVIITKQALREGWDCPFAYVLCARAASTNLSAMTQLVRRILRQPDARKTGVPLYSTKATSSPTTPIQQR